MKKTLVIALALCVTGVLTRAADGEKKPQAPARQSILEKYDKNSNGKLDPDEREALRKDREAERIKRFDKNGDGKLDEKEQEAARSEFRKRRGESAPSGGEQQKKEAPAK